MESPDYIKINKNSWNRKTDIHINSEFYDNENFIKGQSSLNTIELELLGDIRGENRTTPSMSLWARHDIS